MGTKLTKKVVINDPNGDVVFDGVDFTLDGYIEVKAAKSLTLKNCRIYQLTTGSAKAYWLKVSCTTPMKLVIENCFFGENGAKMYNLIEPQAKLITGTSFSENYLKAHSATHNSFSVYDSVDDSTIDMNGNVFECYTPGLRIGVKGDVTCSINCKNNTVQSCITELDGTDSAWYGICCVQPYATQTSSFAHMTVDVTGCEMPEGSPYAIYGYSGSKDTMLDETNAPVVVNDGTQVPLTICH